MDHRGGAESAEEEMVAQADLDSVESINVLSGKVIGAAIEVHKALGPGLLESAYAQCLCRELSLQDIPFERERRLPVE